jgi:hypothetical protein
MSVQNIQPANTAMTYTQRPQEVGAKPFFPALEADQQAKAVQSSLIQAGDVLTQDEKSFFEEVFPSAAQQIREYHAYGRDGSRVAVATGTVVDRRG